MVKICLGSSTTIASLTRNLSLSFLIVGSLISPSWGQVKEVEIVGNPIVKEDKVTVRVKVKDKDDKPMMGLQDTNFSLVVDGKPVKFKNKDWKSAGDTVPPPAWVVVLLDYSGSMNQLDTRGTTKLAGAIQAIKEFTNVLAERAANTQVAVVPFGDPGTNCAGNPVNAENLDKFFPASDFKLINYLDFLASQSPCASTNIYEPLTRTIRFLSNSEDSRFSVAEDSKQPPPRLSVILLSDGYHNKLNEAKDFENLVALLKRNEQIIVHTLGYGLTPAQLGQKYKLAYPTTPAKVTTAKGIPAKPVAQKPKLGRPATRKDIGIGEGKVPEEEFVDQSRLKQIAQATGGIAEFSPDSQAVADKLKLFLNALLGEYEISYIEPNSERGSKHDVKVVVQSGSSKLTSPAKSYTIEVFGRSLPLNIRLIMLFSVLLLLGVGGVLPFWMWAQSLKREALDT